MQCGLTIFQSWKIQNQLQILRFEALSAGIWLHTCFMPEGSLSTSKLIQQKNYMSPRQLEDDVENIRMNSELGIAYRLGQLVTGLVLLNGIIISLSLGTIT